MISVKTYFAVAEYQRENRLLCNIESVYDFFVKFCKRNVEHPCNIASHHAKPIAKKMLEFVKNNNVFFCSDK